MAEASPKVLKKIQTLDKLAADLRSGQQFNITRLTMLKSLCEDSAAAAQFALFLAKKAQQQLKASSYLAPEIKQQYQRLASKAVREMTKYLKEPTQEAESALFHLQRELRDAQNTHKRLRGGPVRIIECKELLVVETALECVVRSSVSAGLGYDVARQYAERYDPRYGTGLIPESAPLVEDIAEFWGRYFLGRGWRNKLRK
ncbi:MAG: hypothetical protein WD049_09095 [Candidatus Paceibacterota bacterium]